MFLRGSALSFAFALGGVLFWWLGAAFTGVGSSWILSWLAALAIGGLAGTGMSVGYGIEDLLSGIAAAVIAFMAIVGGKVLIFLAVVLVANATIGNFDEDTETLEEELAAEKMPEVEADFAAETTGAKDTSDEEGNEEITVDEVMGQNVAVDEMDDGEVLDEEAAWDEPEYDSNAIDGMGMGAFAFFFIMMFGFGDLILLPLSCYVAYHVGSGERFD